MHKLLKHSMFLLADFLKILLFLFTFALFNFQIGYTATPWAGMSEGEIHRTCTSEHRPSWCDNPLAHERSEQQVMDPWAYCSEIPATWCTDQYCGGEACKNEGSDCAGACAERRNEIMRRYANPAPTPTPAPAPDTPDPNAPPPDPEATGGGTTGPTVTTIDQREGSTTIVAGPDVDTNLANEAWYVAKQQRENAFNEKLKTAIELFNQSVTAKPFQPGKLGEDPDSDAATMGATEVALTGGLGGTAMSGAMNSSKTPLVPDDQRKNHNESILLAKRAAVKAIDAIDGMKELEDKKVAADIIRNFRKKTWPDKRVNELLMVAVAAFQDVYCVSWPKSQLESLSYHHFKAASAIYIANVVNILKNSRMTAEALQEQHTADGTFNQVIAKKALVHITDEELDFNNKLIAARELYSAQGNWAYLTALHEKNTRLRLEREFRKRFNYHSKKEKRAKKKENKAAEFFHGKLRKRYEVYLYRAERLTKMHCGDAYDKKFDPYAKGFNGKTVTSTFIIDMLGRMLNEAHAEDPPDEAAAEDMNYDLMAGWYDSVRKANYEELKITQVTAEGRESYYRSMGVSSLEGLPDLVKSQNDRWDFRMGLSKLYKKAYRALMADKKEEAVVQEKIDQKRKYYDLNVNAYLGCPTCPFDPLHPSFGDVTAKAQIGGGNGVDLLAMADKFRSKLKSRLGIFEQLKKLKNVFGDEKAKVPFRGSFENALKKAQKKMAAKGHSMPGDFFTTFLFKKTKGGGPVQIPLARVEKDEDAGTETKKVTKRKRSGKSKGEDDGTIKITPMSELATTEADLTAEEKNTEYEFIESEKEEIIEDTDISIWMVISNRYLKTGLRRLSSNYTAGVRPASTNEPTDGIQADNDGYEDRDVQPENGDYAEKEIQPENSESSEQDIPPVNIENDVSPAAMPEENNDDYGD